jgi:chromosome segregation ATPase
MKEIPFSTALRAEIDAVVARYEALVSARQETLDAVRERDSATLRAALSEAQAERDAARVERDGVRAGEAALQREMAGLRGQIAELSRALDESRERLRALESEARSAGEAARALEEQFAAEQGFVAACAGLEGCLLAEALKSAAGREIEANPATYAALKSRGLEVLLTQAFRERGRSVVQAPLLERESRALPGIAAAAGCELIVPAAGQRFVSTAMDKASTASEPAEEGNVLSCLMPGARRLGTEGALVLPRVVVASG